MNEEKQQPILLIVDDEPANLHVLARLMREEYRILVANCGRKALELTGADPKPDLILLDIQMPDIDGFEVCRHLKEDPGTSSIPVIFVTARDSSGDEEAGFALGAVDYVSKPYQPALVRARVRTHMRLKQKTDLLEKLALIDGLTDVPNRRNFEDQFDRELRRAERDGVPLSVIMMDIDNFKPFNDHYGHGAGDTCLRRVAGALSDVAGRPRDLVARYGGEEFVALLPSTDVDGAVELAEQFRNAVESLRIPHQFSDAAPIVTLSLGVATLGSIQRTPGDRRDPESVDTLLKRADTALYEAKKLGKNQVSSA